MPSPAALAAVPCVGITNDTCALGIAALEGDLPFGALAPAKGIGAGITIGTDGKHLTNALLDGMSAPSPTGSKLAEYKAGGCLATNAESAFDSK